MASNTQHGDAPTLEQRISIQKEIDPEVVDEKSVGESQEIMLDQQKEKKLLLKLDLAFVPIIMLTYLSCFLDRSNIGELRLRSQVLAAIVDWF